MMIGSLEFTAPIWLALLLLVPIVFLIARRSKGALVYSSLSLLHVQSTSWRQRLAWIPSLLSSITALLLIFALSGPRVGNRNTEIKKEGIAIMMVIDSSSSMRALDLSEEREEMDRLAISKRIFEDFVLGTGSLNGRRSDSIGIVRFAGFADTACPLTLDHESLVGVARTLEIVEDRSEDGTAIGDALALAVSRLKDSPARSKVVILLTDGVNNSGIETPLAAAELARAEGVKVYTIGAGTNGMAPIRVQDPFTGRSTLRGVPVQIDEATLKTISERSGGRYFRATDFDSLGNVYQSIDALERTEMSQRLYRQYTEYYLPLTLLALLCGIVAFLLDETVFRRLP